MKVSINGAKYDILPSELLTVSQYNRLMEMNSVDISNYLSLFCPVKFKDIQDTIVNRKTITTLTKWIGKIQPFEYYLLGSKPREFIYNKKIYQCKDFDWQTAGARSLISQRMQNTENVILLSVYMLAILLSDGYDVEEIISIYVDLLACNYNDVMPAAGFFLNKCMPGLYSGQNFLTRFIMLLLIKMRHIIKRLARTD